MAVIEAGIRTDKLTPGELAEVLIALLKVSFSFSVLLAQPACVMEIDN